MEILEPSRRFGTERVAPRARPVRLVRIGLVGTPDGTQGHQIPSLRREEPVDASGARARFHLALQEVGERHVDATVVAGNVPRGDALGHNEGVLIEGVRLVSVPPRDADGSSAHRRGGLSTWRWGGEPVVLVTRDSLLPLAAAVEQRSITLGPALLDRERLAARLVARREPTLVISGQTPPHATLTQRSVLQLKTGPLVSPVGYAVIEIRILAADTVLVSRETMRGYDLGGELAWLIPSEREQWFFDGVTWSHDPAADAEWACRREA